jgi:hypothetical protein
VRPPGRARQTAARHLSARARERQAALVVLVDHVNEWPEGGDLALSVGAIEWEGVGRGHGHLQGRRAEVRVSGRRSAGRAMECTLWLPAGSGVVAARAEDGPAEGEDGPAEGEDGPAGTGSGEGPEAA